MNQLRMFSAHVLRRFGLALILSLIATSLACSSLPPVRDVERQAITTRPEKTVPEVESAILSAGAKRGWSMEIVEPGHILASIRVRAHEAKVDIYYDAAAFSIRYKDSANLKFDGTRIHRKYNLWIEKLRSDIVEEVTKTQ